MSASPPAAARFWHIVGWLARAARLAACTAHTPSPATGTSPGRSGPHRPGAGTAMHGLSSSSPGRPQITVARIPAAGSGQSIVLPLEAYEQVASQEQDTGLAAFGLLTQRCMQAKGFSYSAPHNAPAAWPRWRPLRSSRPASPALPGQRLTATASPRTRMCPAGGWA